MNIISIDPGFSKGTKKVPHGTGVAVWRDNKLVQNFLIKVEGKGFQARFESIIDGLWNAITGLKKYDIVIEKSHYGKFKVVNELFLELFGAIQYVYGDCEFIAPTSVKRIVAGSGKATKNQVKLALQVLYRDQPEAGIIEWYQKDCIDAVAIGLAYLRDKGEL